MFDSDYIDELHQELDATKERLKEAESKLNQESVNSDMRAHQTDGLSRENIALRERLQSAEYALEFYADERNYGAGELVWKRAEIEKDFGEKAQNYFESEKK